MGNLTNALRISRQKNQCKYFPAVTIIKLLVSKYGDSEDKRILGLITALRNSKKIDSTECTLRIRALYKRKREMFEAMRAGKTVKMLEEAA